MELTLILMLGACLLAGGLLYYVFVVRRAKDIFARGKSAAIVFLFVLVPILVFALWSQNQAIDRLQQLGFRPHPDIESSVGVATGVGKEPVWLFQVSSDIPSILSFYQLPENHDGWTLVESNSNAIAFRRGKEQMLLLIEGDKLAFSYSRE